MDSKETRKLVIIGSGPAGLSAGIYAARANINPLIFDGPTPGGQLISTSYVENWPGERKITGAQLMTNIREHSQSLGCKIVSESIAKIDTSERPFTLTTDKENKFQAQAIILATGARPKKLKIPGEEKYWAKGVSSCAICDGALYRDKEVIIVGGGDTAMENASFMNNFTNKIIVIQILDKLTASFPMQKRVLDNKNIKILYNSAVEEIIGDGDRLKEISVVNQKTGEKTTIKADGLFISIGLKPSTEFVKDVIELDKWGYVKIWKNKNLGITSTSIDGIFAAGDVSDYIYRQAITASGMGCMAALDAEKFLTSK